MRIRPARQGILLPTILTLIAINGPRAIAVAEGTADVVGSWKGGEVLDFARPDSQVVFFCEQTDGSLDLCLIYEVGPRARVWTYDIDVTYRDGRISWAYHEGHLNATRDTMGVKKNYKGDRSEWRWVRDRGADPLMNQFRALDESPCEYAAPQRLDDGWLCATPEDVGLNRAHLVRLLNDIAQGNLGDVHSVLLARHGALVVEKYFAKQGAWHGPLVDSVFRERVHHLASITKSVTSTLVGIAIDRRFIASVEDPVGRYLPPYASLFDGEKEAVTIEHLLTMSSGLEWFQSGRRIPRNDNHLVWSCDDVVAYVLEKPLVAEPGKRFVYSNGSLAVVGAVLANATDRTVAEFAGEYLFDPLGITDYLWTAYPDGTAGTDGGLALRPRDLAKIGQVFLAQGRWQETQVVPAGWVARATERRHSFRSGRAAPLGYGYCWVLAELPLGGEAIGAFFHSGDGGQHLMVIPELDMVVVFTAGTYGINANRRYLGIMEEYILPAVASGP